MTYPNAYQILIDSKQFKSWQKNHLGSYLTHFYRTLDDQYNLTNYWEIGFYDKKTDKITAFVIGEKIAVKPEETPFRPEGLKIDKLDLKEIKLIFQQALEIFQQVRQHQYPREILLSGFLILQNFQEKNIWNISFATRSFNILNVKIDASTKELVSHQLVNFIEKKAS